MPTEKITFKNKMGFQLSAKIDYPLSKKPYPYAIFAHVFTGNKNLKSARHISRALTLNGVAVLRFDFTGLGESEGSFEETNFTSNVEDIIAASDYLTTHHRAPSIIIGHSLGGAASLFAGARIESINAIVTIGAPSYPEHVTHLLKEDLDTIEANGCARVEIDGRQFVIKKQFLDDLKNQDHVEIIQKLKKALLVMHSPQDSVVEIENAANIYHLARHPKSFITLDGADHMLTTKEDAFYAGQVIASWVQRYVPFRKDEKLRTDQQVVVRLKDEDRFTTDIQAGPHGYVADEPEQVGGYDFGPDPYELLNSALGACTAMTLQMYARRKGWPLEDVIVHLSHHKTTQYHEDAAHPEESSSKIDRFERTIELVGPLDQEQRDKLLLIANKCPIHRTLDTPQVFATKLLGDEEWS
ncbi:MAG: alpha/beta fold hydrolase [Bacteroidota bacterium]